MEFNANDLLEYASETYLFLEKSFPIKMNTTKGNPHVLLITGENASGKSYLAHLLARLMYNSDYKTDPMVSSMRSRTREGISRAMVFGSEEDDSTGNISAKTIKKAINNAKGRIEEYGSSLIILDEPELGLSDSYKKACGELIGEGINQIINDDEIKNKNIIVIITTHSKDLVSGLISELKDKPTFVSINKDLDLTQWLEEKIIYSKDDLIKLSDKAHQTRKAIWKAEDNAISKAKKTIENDKKIKKQILKNK